MAARVFPVPVGAMRRTLSPLRIAGMESSWMGLASRKPTFSSLFRTGGFRTEKAELAIYRTRYRWAVHKPETGVLARLTHGEIDGIMARVSRNFGSLRRPLERRSEQRLK